MHIKRHLTVFVFSHLRDLRSYLKGYKIGKFRIKSDARYKHYTKCSLQTKHKKRMFLKIGTHKKKGKLYRVIGKIIILKGNTVQMTKTFSIFDTLPCFV